MVPKADADVPALACCGEADEPGLCQAVCKYFRPLDDDTEAAPGACEAKTRARRPEQIERRWTISARLYGLGAEARGGSTIEVDIFSSRSWRQACQQSRDKRRARVSAFQYLLSTRTHCCLPVTQDALSLLRLQEVASRGVAESTASEPEGQASLSFGLWSRSWFWTLGCGAFIWLRRHPKSSSSRAQCEHEEAGQIPHERFERRRKHTLGRLFGDDTWFRRWARKVWHNNSGLRFARGEQRQRATPCDRGSLVEIERRRSNHSGWARQSQRIQIYQCI